MRVHSVSPKFVSVVLAVGLASTSVGIGVPASGVGPEVYPVPVDGVFRMEGSGWGHGRGMSQWGAYQAAAEGNAHRAILGFYYPGTTLAVQPAKKVRVLLATDTDRSLVVRASTGLKVRYGPSGALARTLPSRPTGCLTPATAWRARATTTGMRVDARCGTWRTVIPGITAPTVSFLLPGGLVSTVNGEIRRGYRGTVAATRISATTLQVVNHVSMETYLRPVVAAEVSSSWPEESLRAQAVAARSYAAHEALGRASMAFDVYDSVRSQAYPGSFWYDASWRVIRTGEHPATDAAIRDTAGLHVMAGATPALTQFGASNGGVTAASPLSYMTVKVDKWDARALMNPRLRWTDTVTASALAARCSGSGPVSAVRVLAREGAGPWGGRISRMEIVGKYRTCPLVGDSAIRSTLGVNSSVLTFTG
jgi:SpoIID/LytB domain protein